MQTIRRGAGSLLLAVSTSLGCGVESPKTEGLPELPPRARRSPPVIVIGIDGAEWRLIRQLWEQGRLPNLKRIANGGITAELVTDYGASPVIWTTIATGRTPDAHGITDFVVDTGSGAVPVSSSVRRVPALWNMATRARLRTGVFGWWASWPAESVSGVVVSDRAHLPVERAVSPLDYSSSFEPEREAAAREFAGLGGGLRDPDLWMEDGASRDRIVAHEARRFLGAGFDLFLVYFRTVDIASHRYWKLLEPDRYRGVTEEELARGRDVIPTVYDATDAAIGRILDAWPEEANVFVVSDHGFVAGPEEHFVFLDIDEALEQLGYLVRDEGGVDFAQSLAYSVGSAGHDRLKKVRFSVAGREPGGAVDPGDVDELAARLAGDLGAITYANGRPVFQPRVTELPVDADLVAEVQVDAPTLELRFGDEVLEDVVLYINEISGTHNAQTNGIFIAHGPDLRSSASAEGISILDLAPTILYALGLPVGEDFDGRAWEELFEDEFRSRHPLRWIPSWGTMETWGVETSPVDTRLLEELRALGYI